jgi:hypothetical protein
MLGFLPENSTQQNLQHGERLLRQCAHGSIRQIHKWWQDPNMYYAFETKKGAAWFAKHGGPPNFMSMVAENAAEPCAPGIANPFEAIPVCHSCMKPFDSFTKPIPILIYRCMCGTKIVHPGCFMPNVCPICRVKASMFTREQSILSCT